MDTGVVGSAFSKLTNYDGTSMTYTVSATDSISSGTIYTFKVLAKNAIGSSEFSSTIRVAVSTLPATPSAPTKNIDLSTNSSIYVQWTQSLAT